MRGRQFLTHARWALTVAGPFRTCTGFLVDDARPTLAVGGWRAAPPRIGPVDSPVAHRLVADACPGVARPFAAADGAIVRLRTGGQPVAVESLAGLLSLVAGQPEPAIQLTSRGALQLRALPEPLPAGAHARILATGLVPSATHELARNIVASPLSGLDGLGVRDVRPLVAALDEGLCADPALAALPGRFLFAVDDGRGDVIGSSFDVGLFVTSADSVTVMAGGAGAGWVVGTEAAVVLALDLAREFLAARERLGSGAWHVSELGVPIGPEGSCPVTLTPASPARLGGHDRHAVVGVPLGLVTPTHVAALGGVTDRIIVTPWRSLVIEGGAASLDRLAAAGLAVSADSPWARLHACTGLPGCAKSSIDTHAFARELSGRMPPLGLVPVHVSGCARRCGAPVGDYVDLLAPTSVDAAISAVAAG